jgi:acylphosphatase
MSITLGVMTSRDVQAVAVVVTGIVQGVAFRWYAQAEARRLGVSGWVRNDVDGSVRAYAVGEDVAVSDFVAWCHHGPPAASVRSVIATPAVRRPVAGFEITG